MEIRYSKVKLEKQCTDLKSAQKLFGGDKDLARSLMARINALKMAQSIKDIIAMPNFRFHSLYGKREGQFAIDVKTRKQQWRIVLEPLDDNGERYVPCNIDEIADVVRIVEIEEISKHYE